MDTQPSAGGQWPREGLEALLRHALLLDLEVSHQGKILKAGAVLGSQTFARAGNAPGPGVLDELARLADSARCVLGHNLVRHDLPVLSQTAPGHPLLRLPIIDTLVLSPIAFPENPYHRLVKDYKLVRESMNDPVADARQAAALFGDEFRSLEGLRQTEPRLFELLHFLLATPEPPPLNLEQGSAGFHAGPLGDFQSREPEPLRRLAGLGDGDPTGGETGATSEPLASGMEMVFQALGGTRPAQERALALCRELFARWACANTPVEPALLQTGAQRLAVAYAVTWLRVAGSNSVLPPWVRMEHPATGQLIRRLREVPCHSPECAYCRRVHNAGEQLRTFFDLPGFRERPHSPQGGSLQREIVEAGLRDESLLAILPTGAGKSLCFQLPALVRNYRRGVLTIVLSPLQALMKDQVDSLVRRTRTPFAAALYGLLTPLERGDVLRKIALGDVALLYVSPEQLRNRSFAQAIAQREVGCWVFDEAHCLSKWGHDFRPDYLYAGRFIREFAQRQHTDLPAIACFTATAKRDVKEEILAYFKDEAGRELRLFEGGVERDNLRFEVQMIDAHGKLERVHDLLSDRLAKGRGGCALVFRATRPGAEEAANYLQAKGWDAAHFHAGLTPPEKKETQDKFLAGEVRVMCATNAFGMGIDKDDVRLVIHADTPGSLENYLQEAGRAGRDGHSAECVLLFDEQDCEQQFRLGALSELSRRDIAQILRGLRRAAHGEDQTVVITTGEILRDEDVEANIRLEDRAADTKVRTAIAWLERADFIQRDENVTTVFQARPLVKNLPEAEAKMASLHLSATEQALMYLHEQRVIILQHGLAVFRSAMTIRLQPEAKGEKYKTSDYQPLAHHYRERILQVHVMSEYARRGLERIQEALALVLAYFTLDKAEFLRRYFGQQPELLTHATTAQSFQRIVTDLANPAQMKVVTAPVGRNLLILAGPGSGKTRTVVHRCAYLLRVERVRPQSVLVCCFNRHAAIELRRRLAELVGDDARGVTVLTYHGLAMRLLGYSFAARAEKRAAEIDFDALITDAVKLLQGKKLPPGIEPDEVRDRLLAGFQHILVDEYQDIDAPQYDMISALAGRTLDDSDLKLSILAVGDDDQNIYTFRGANVEFIRRFQQDYDAEVHYLVENYRSTRYLIDAANPFIAANRDRMKTEHPIRIDRHRAMRPAGGEFGQRDALSGGKVQVIRVREAGNQAEAVVAEIRRLRALGVSGWSNIAVLSNTHQELAHVRTVAETEGIPIRWIAQRDAMPPLHQIREVHRFLRHLGERRGALHRATELRRMAGATFAEERSNPWVQFLHRLLDAWSSESGDAEVPVHEALEFLYETCAESRREFSFGEGVTLSTVHSAKGTEYDHVLLTGSWPLKRERQEQEETRRVFYVGMTRARHTLTVFDRKDVRPSLPASLAGPALVCREYQGPSAAHSTTPLNYETLSLEDIHLGYPANFPAGHPVHGALARLKPGDRLRMDSVAGNRVGLFDGRDVCVAHLSRKAEVTWSNRRPSIREIRVLAMIHRDAAQDADVARRERYRVSEWEIPLVEIVWHDSSTSSLSH